ncbi:MAG: response regulator transcription factor [Alicyclobacillus sp.]|nr:response regulator transcription factor [Alicyclobacillus sp.]
MHTVMVVEDEAPIADIVRFALEREGYQVVVATDGAAALDAFRTQPPDLVLLDVMLPEVDGFTVCREMRAASNVPIIMLTAREAEVDKVLGLELGADDYVTKPFSIRELLARVRANLRRADLFDSRANEEARERISVHDLVIDFNNYTVTKRGQPVPLTHREFELLSYMASRPGVVFTREQLLVQVWGSMYEGDERTVDVTIRRLREKCEDDPSNPSYVLTKRGVGYFLRRPS